MGVSGRVPFVMGKRNEDKKKKTRIINCKRIAKYLGLFFRAKKCLYRHETDMAQKRLQLKRRVGRQSRESGKCDESPLEPSRHPLTFPTELQRSSDYVSNREGGKIDFTPTAEKNRMPYPNARPWAVTFVLASRADKQRTRLSYMPLVHKMDVESFRLHICNEGVNTRTGCEIQRYTTNPSQSCSSLPSPQSSLPSQRHRLSRHFPVDVHVCSNSSSHVLPEKNSLTIIKLKWTN